MTHRSLLPGGNDRSQRSFSRRHARGSTSVRRALYSFAAALPLILAFQMTTGLLPVKAVDNTGQFCMDGNIEPGGTSYAGSGVSCGTTAPPYHWSDLFNSSGTPILNNAHLLASVFVPDYATPDASYFTQNGAGVKDTNPIANWGCKTQNTPTAKDDIQNAFGAVFQIASTAPENAGDVVVYLGVERLSNVGDSFAGFWLFKNPQVSCSGSGAFNGSHTDGDVLILTNFTNGGGTASVDVYRWQGDDATGAPVPMTTGNVCGMSPGGTGGENVCAVSNAPAATSTTKCTDSSMTIASPWAPMSVPGCTFTEAALDLTQLFKGSASGPCFSNFMAETRSSQQITATLKDFAGALLDTCVAPTVNTTASGHGNSNLPGSAQHDTATMGVPSGGATPTGHIDFFLCDPTQATAAGCPSGAGTQVGGDVALSAGVAQSTPDVSGSTTPSDLATGTYCWGAQYTPDTASQNTYLASYGTDNSNECFTIAKAQPGIATTAAFSSGSSDLSSTPAIGDTVTLTGAAGNPAGESVSFSLFGPYAAGTTPTCATGTNEPVFTTTGTLAATGTAGQFTATTASSYTATATGTYVWEASYNGDTYNLSAAEGCNGANESLSVITPELHITKNAVNAIVSAGSPIGFDITISNDAAASGNATGVVINDPLPGGAGIHWSVSTQSGTACSVNTAAPQTLACNVGTLTPGQSYSVRVISGTNASSCALYHNVATGSATNQTGQNVQASADTTVQCPNISITKKADNATVDAGQSIGFTVVVTNSAAAGTGTAGDVTISDPLPAGSGIDWSIDSQDHSACQINGSVGGQVVNCTIATMAPGDTYTFHVTSGTAFASCATYTNIASVSVGNENGGPFTAQDSSTVDCPGLSILKSADETTPVTTGTPIGFHITVSNSSAAGTGTANNVKVDDMLPAGGDVDWQIASGGDPGNHCSITGAIGSQELKCTLGNMAPGASYTIAITSTTDAHSAGTYPNTAYASADNAPTVHSSATITVIAPDVTVTKTADGGTVNAGSPMGFTVTITNSNADGTGTATGVTVADPLPMGTGINWSIKSQTGTKCMITVTDGGTPGQELDCMAFNLAPGQSYVVDVTTGTEFQSCSVYSNTADVTVPNQVNSPVTASASATVQCPDLGILKAADATPVSTGTPIGFKVVISNGGPGTATNVQVDDPLPGGTGISWSIDTQDATACTIVLESSVQHLTCNLGDMAAKASYTVHITSATTSGSAGTYPNTATVTADNAPTQQSSATIVVRAPALTITKTADASPVLAGNSIGFTVAVSNSSAVGTGTATGVTIHDPLPSANGANWSISPAYSGPGTCSITGSAGNQTLVCNLGTMAPGATASVHITSSTSSSACNPEPNTASVAASNAAGSQASATVSMICVQVQAANIVVPATGVGSLIPTPALALIASGIMLVMGVVIRRRRTRD